MILTFDFESKDVADDGKGFVERCGFPLKVFEVVVLFDLEIPTELVSGDGNGVIAKGTRHDFLHCFFDQLMHAGIFSDGSREGASIEFDR